MALERYLALPGQQEQINSLVQKAVRGVESYELESHLGRINWDLVTLDSNITGFHYKVHLAMPEGLIKLEEVEIALVPPEKVNLSFKGFVAKKPNESILVLNIKNKRINDWGFRSLVIKSNGRLKVSADELGIDSLRVFANDERNGRGKSRVLTQVVAINQKGIKQRDKNLISEAVVFVGCYGRTHEGKLISGFVVEKPRLQNFNEEAYRNFLWQRLAEEGYSADEAKRMIDAVCQDLS